MTNLLFSISLLLLQDVDLGPYRDPAILPPSADHIAAIYGDRLFEDAAGMKYVIHLSSGAKVYNPVIYDESHPFELQYNPRGLKVFNAWHFIASAIMPSPKTPEVVSGSVDYVTYEIPGAHWGLYFANNQVDTNAQGYETVGVWPPSVSVQNYFESNYGVSDYNQLQFRSSIRSRQLGTDEIAQGYPASAVALIRSESFAVIDFEMSYAPLLVGQGFSNSSLSHRLHFTWAGKTDLNIDGQIDSNDLNQFEAWISARDLRADFDENNRIDVADRVAFSDSYSRATSGTGSGSNPVAPDAGSGGDSKGNISGGCALVVRR